MLYKELDNDKSSRKNLMVKRPIRILHIVGAMVRAGTETWLMHILRQIDRQQFQMDFLVFTNEPCPYDDEIRALGSRIIPCTVKPSQPWSFARDFKQILQDYGPYDIVHSHVHHFSGLVLRSAKQAGIAIRIAHSHNDTSPVDKQASILRHLYISLSEIWIKRHATLGLAASKDAAKNLFSSSWQQDSRWQILCCGIDLSAFSTLQEINGDTLRRELDIPSDALVFGHVGRFENQKNHCFLIEVAAQVIQQEPKAYFLLIGDGPLRSDIEATVVNLSLESRIMFAGLRSDVPQLMMGVMDAFVFPSLYEGLGLALVEAQAAGLPSILSDVIPREADIVQPLIKRVSLTKKADYWAMQIIAHYQAASTVAKSDALTLINQSPLNIETSLKQLTAIYQAQFSEKQEYES
jgi:glycosyltransferase involved in cell wall biosynthesis